MTTEAFAKRRYERQELLRQLMQEVFNVEESSGGKESMSQEERIGFNLDLVQVLAAHLKGRIEPHKRADDIDHFASSFFFREEILPRVASFSRADEETDQLLCELMGKLQASVGIHFQSTLSRLESLDPQRIFHAPSAMAEVPIEGS